MYFKKRADPIGRPKKQKGKSEEMNMQANETENKEIKILSKESYKRHKMLQTAIKNTIMFSHLVS